MPPDQQTPAENVGSKAWARNVRSKAQGLAKDIESYCMALGEILYRVYDTPIDGDPRNGPIYKAWGFNSFADYAERELGLHRKKAEQLRGIWYHIEIQLARLEKPVREQLFALGFSKLREIKRVLDIDNAKWWAERAPTMNYQTVLDTVSKVRDARENASIESAIRAGGDPVKQSNDLDRDPNWHLHPVADTGPRPESYWTPPETEEQFNKRFVFNAEQLETVKLAIQRAAELSNSKSSGKNISLICLDFLSNNDFSSAKMEQRLRFVAKMEKLLGLRLVAVDPDMNEVLYGLSTLQALAAESATEDSEAEEGPPDAERQP
jgi:hypothetical protein